MAIGGSSAEVVVDVVFESTKAGAGLTKHLQEITRDLKDFNKNPIISKNFTQPLGRITGAADEFTKSLEASNARVLAFGASAGAIFAVQKAMQELVKTTISVEQALTDINVLLNVSDKNFKKFSDGLFDVARKTGTAFQAVAESANEFARQGLGVEATLKRTNAALALSKLGMMDSVNATESLTAALNTFRGEVTDAETVVNKLAQVDAKFAVSSKDLAEAIKRTGSSAKSASVSFEELLAAVTVTQEVTARGGAVIGNAFKTIFTRIQRPEVLSQLKNIGVRVKDSSGEILPAIQILKQYGAVYDSLTPALRSNTSQLIAGGRQINILKALLPELASGTGKFDLALKVANETTTEATDRLSILTSTTKGTLNALTANLTKSAAEIGNISIKPAIDNILKGLDTIADLVSPSTFFGLGETVGKGVYEGIGKVISGPGIVLLGTVLAKLGGNLLKFVSTSSVSFLGLNKAAESQATTQTIITNILAKRPQILEAVLKSELSISGAVALINTELSHSEKHYENLIALAQQLAAHQGMIGAASGGETKLASGLIPNFVPNFAMADVVAEREAASKGGYRAGQIRRRKIEGVGDVTYNGKEEVKQFPGMQQPAIMPPALSQAGKDYRGKFKNTLGFDPYNSGAAFGFVPSFSTGGLGANTHERFLTSEEKKDLNSRVGSGKRGFWTGLSDTRKAELMAESEGVTSGQQKEQEKLVRQAALKGGTVDVGRKIGILSLLGNSSDNKSTQTSLGQITAFNDILSDPDLTKENRKILKEAPIKFTGVQVSSLTGMSEEMARDKGGNVYSKFSDTLNQGIVPILANLATDTIGSILGNQGPKVAEVIENMGSKRLLSTGAEGALFESAVNFGTKSPAAFLQAAGGSGDAPWDFEEKGPVMKKLADMFPDGDSLLRADAKRTAEPRQIRSVIKKSYNSVLANVRKSHMDKIVQKDFNLPYLGDSISQWKGVGDITSTSKGPFKPIQRQGLLNQPKTSADGFVPNFSLKAISNAVQREDRSGVRRDKIRVGYDRRLAASGGIGVYNTDEGNLGNAINMHMAAGRNKSAIQRQGKASGFVPNFATRLGKELRKRGIEVGRGQMQSGVLQEAGLTSAGKGGGFAQGLSPVMKKIEAAVEAASTGIGAFGADMKILNEALNKATETTNIGIEGKKEAIKVGKTQNDSIKKSTKSRERSVASMSTMILLGGQLDVWGAKLAESKNGLLSFIGSVASTAGTLAMWTPTIETTFRILGVKGNTLGDQFRSLGLAAIAAAVNLKTMLLNFSISQMIGGKGGVGSIAKNFKKGKLGRAGGAFGRGPRVGGGLRGGLGAVAGGGGAVGGLAKGGAALLANPITAVVAAAAIGAIYWTKKKQKEEVDAFERIRKASEKTKRQFSELASALDQMSVTSAAYREALIAGDKEEQKRLRLKLAKDLGGGALDQFFKRSGKTITLKSGKKFTSEKEVTDAVMDPTLGSAERDELSNAAKRVTSSYEKLEVSTQEASLVFAHFNKNQRWWKSSVDLTPELIKKAATSFENLIINSELSGKELKDLATGFTNLKSKIKGMGSYIDEGDAMELSKEFKALIHQIPMEENARKELIGRINKISKITGVSEEGLAALYSEIADRLIPRLKTQSHTTANLNKANEELEKKTRGAIDVAKAVRVSFRALVENFDISAKTLATSNKMLSILEDFENQREKIIRDSNNKILSALTTDFFQLTKTNKARESETLGKERLSVLNLAQRDQENQMEIKNKNSFFSDPNIMRGAAKGFNTAQQKIIIEMGKKLDSLIKVGTSGADLAKVVKGYQDVDLAKYLTKGGGQGATDPADVLLKLRRSFIAADETYRNQQVVLEETIKQEKNLNKIKAATALLQLKENQKLKFGSGIFETPFASERKLNLARQDVVAGQRLGDRDRETKGLIAQAKFFQGFQFAGKSDGTGGVNPAAALTSRLALRFQKNAISQMEKMTGRKATEAEKIGAFEMARKKALALTKDDKEVKLNLIDAQSTLTIATKENTAALKDFTATFNLEAPILSAEDRKKEWERWLKEQSRKAHTPPRTGYSHDLYTPPPMIPKDAPKNLPQPEISATTTTTTTGSPPGVTTSTRTGARTYNPRSMSDPGNSGSPKPPVTKTNPLPVVIVSPVRPGNYGAQFTERPVPSQTPGRRQYNEKAPAPKTFFQKLLDVIPRKAFRATEGERKLKMMELNPAFDAAMKNLKDAAAAIESNNKLGIATGKAQMARFNFAYKVVEELKRERKPVVRASTEQRTIDHDVRHQAMFDMWRDIFGLSKEKIRDRKTKAAAPKGPPVKLSPKQQEIKDAQTKAIELKKEAAEAQVGAFLLRADKDNAFANAFDPAGIKSLRGGKMLSQAQEESLSGPEATTDDIQRFINQSREMAQVSLNMGLKQKVVEERRIKNLGLIDRLEALSRANETEDNKIQKEKLKTQIERNFASENFIQSSYQAEEATRRFSGSLITTTELQAAAQDKLNKSYHDGAKFAEALGDALGSRFKHNMATARKQASDSLVGVVDDFKQGSKDAFFEAVKGTKTLREAFGELFDRLADRILRDSLDMGVDALFGAIGSGAKGLASHFGGSPATPPREVYIGIDGAPLNSARGGLIRGYNSGGFVNQGSGVRDDVPAMMQGGEYVIRKSSVDKYGRGLFESLNSGGIVGYARGDRVMRNRSRAEFVYNDAKSPTSGSWQGGAGLSSYAMMESGSPMIAFQKEREKILERYIKERAAYDEMVAQAKMAFRTAQRKRMQGAITAVAIQVATAGLNKLAAADWSSTADAGSGFTADGSAIGTNVAGDVKGVGGGTSFTPGDTFDASRYNEVYMPRHEVSAKWQQAKANGGLIKAFARGGRNRDNIPAMLMGGEYVMNKQSVDKYGVGLFNGLNNGTARGFAEGGPVGASAGGGAPSIANNNFEININITGDGETETTSSSSEGDTTREQGERNEKLGMAVQEAVQLELIDQQRPGGLLYREDRF